MFSLILEQDLLSATSTALLVLFASFLFLLLATWSWTSLSFALSPTIAKSRPNKKPLSAPPILPYSIPWLGSTFSFLDQRPGYFWDNLRKKLAGQHDATTILLGGDQTSILFSPVSIQSLYKAKHVSRERFNHDIMVKALGLSEAECHNFTRADHALGDKIPVQEEIYHEFLLRSSAVNVLTAKFMETFQQELSKMDNHDSRWESVLLANWLRDKMFVASTTALMGSTVLTGAKNVVEDFWIFDANILRLFFGLPKAFAKAGHDSLNRLLDSFEEWHRFANEKYDSARDDEKDWEPLFGSKLTRARRRLYQRAGLSMRGRAGLDLGFLFGLNSNAIPSTNWMLFHILLSPPSDNLLPRLLAEIRTAVNPDGTISVPVLVALPLLQSVYSECLRLYSDQLITREIKESLILPSSHPSSSYVLQKGSIVMAPTYITHTDEKIWHDLNPEHPSASEFYAERFLKQDEDGKIVYSTAGTTGLFFPYGGGQQMCPGRVFAKQEILGAVAVLLSKLEFEVEPGQTVPSIPDHFTGAGVVPVGGDIRVKIRWRQNPL